jgi:two-component system, response regulator
LLVEDNESDVELTLHALRREGLINQIQISRDGEEALDFLFCNGAYADRCFESQPKLVLLDLKLPKVDGMEVLRRLKSDPRTRTIPVVILTSSKEERDVVESYSLGANSYIQKPMDFEQFRETVKTTGLYWLLLNQRRWRCPRPWRQGSHSSLAERLRFHPSLHSRILRDSGFPRFHARPQPGHGFDMDAEEQRINHLLPRLEFPFGHGGLPPPKTLLKDLSRVGTL